MELKKWIPISSAVVLGVAAVLIVRAADPATQRAVVAPTTRPTPLVAAPTTAPSSNRGATAMDNSRYGSAADNSSNNYNNRGRNRNRGRGNNNSGNTTLAVGADAYAVLRQRSIFVKGNQTIIPESGPTAGYVQPRGQAVGVAESLLVFNGVIVVNDEADALVEDLTSHEVMTVRPGDAIAGGRISSIAFDDLSYEAKGRTLHVSIGQTLQGMAPPESAFSSGSSGSSAPAAVTPPAPATPGFGAGGVTATPAGPTPGAAPATPAETSASDLEARMKARRLQQNGGN